jgi:stearoyl-CoA desaturase (Delta-9 desaturase)
MPSPTSIRITARRSLSFGQIFNFLGVVAIHAGTAYIFTRGVTWRLAALAAATYFVRMFAITAVYHRYFSHRAYKTSRGMQLFLAVLGTTATQKGPLWWASTHRIHHKLSDTDRDVHSPMRRGFYWAHMGWWLSREHENTDWAQIPDFAGYPELRWLEKWAVIGPLGMIGALWLLGGFNAFAWGYVVSTCFLLHGTFTINSLAHVFGSRRYATTDTSRNNLWLALLTMGEGWHNNHHHYQSSANQGFFWWEIDASFYALKALEKFGLVWDLRGVPEHVKRRHLLREVGERAPLLLANGGEEGAAEATGAVVVDPEPDLG